MSSENTAQDPTESTHNTGPKCTISDIILFDGRETEVFLEIWDGEVTFWDQASDGNLVAVAKHPEEIENASKLLESCDFTDIDGDGNSDFTASFLFENGGTASLLWSPLEALYTTKNSLSSSEKLFPEHNLSENRHKSFGIQPGCK